MTCANEKQLSASFRLGPKALAEGIGRLAEEDALSLPLLERDALRRLIGATTRLPFRPATPMIGEGARAVRQEFDLCMAIPPRNPLHDFAASLGRLVDSALARLDPAPLPRPFCFNDLIVQRYPRGSLGITPHRDHIRYEGLVALITLSGAARFFLCADRAGREAREVPCPPGNLLLLRGPGFAGRSDRPFHFLREVTRPRLGLGLRHDVRAEPSTSKVTHATENPICQKR
jgi:hypothetical protein